MTDRPLKASFGQFVGYGVGDFGMNLFWQSMPLLMLYWYTNVVGVSPVMAGTVYLIGTIWDAVTDPVMATIAERTRTRWGSYRPYLIFGGAALCLSFVVLLWSPPFTGTPLILTLIFAHLFFRTSYTLIGVPYSALTTRITADSQERTILSGLRMFFAFLGYFAVSALAFPIIRYFGDGTDVGKEGFTCFAAICGAVAFVCYLICFATTRENIRPRRMPPKSLLSTVRDMALFMRRNPAMHTMSGIILLHSAANHILLSTIPFFVDTHADLVRPKEEIQGLNALLSLSIVPVATVLAYVLGKRRTWIVTACVIILAGLHLALFGPLLINGFVLQIAVMGISGSAFGVLMWSMIPDTVEFGEWKTGIRSESAAFGLTMFMQKASSGLAGFAVGLMLDLAGYGPNLSPGAAAAVGDNIRLLLALGPVVLLLLSMVVVALHPVSKDAHQEAVSSCTPEGAGGLGAGAASKRD